jgi:hypothetical protein
MISIAVREFNVVFDERLLTILRMTIRMAINSLRTAVLQGCDTALWFSLDRK